METLKEEKFLEDINKAKDDHKFIVITDLPSYYTVYNKDLPEGYFVDEINVFSQRVSNIRALFDHFYPMFNKVSINFAIEYDDFYYIITLIKRAIDYEDYEFLELIVSKNLQHSIYKRAYRFAKYDTEAKNIIWKRIAPTIVNMYVFLNNVIDIDAAKVIKDRFNKLDC